jgi:tetratricopeptide (TPR) repeat protein
MPRLEDQIAACQAASLLTVSGAEHDPRYFVHRWTATELAERAAASGPAQLTRAHRQAAAYWQWRVQVWPQDTAADVHDLLEARHHLLQAGDTEQAAQVTESIVIQLETWGAWDQETALIHEMISQLPADSARKAAWTGQLGNIAYRRGDYDIAARQYQTALGIFERLGDQAGMATGSHQLGMLAQDRGDYAEAARQYQRSLDIKERLGDQAGMANSYHNLGILARMRGDYEEAARQYQRALDIFERLGDQAGMARSYHSLGILAQVQGDYEEAARQYQRSLDIRERLGDQAGMAASYSQLGFLEQERGGQITIAVAWHVRALTIRLALEDPQALINLGRLGEYRRELGPEPFTSLLASTAENTDLADVITPLLDQLDNSDSGTG